MNAELPQVGETLGERYELRELLGEGGVSVVFRAHDRVGNRDVALKLLTPRYLGRTEREQRLLNEGRYLELLRGVPEIVELLGSGRFEDRHGWPYLALSLLEGRTLDWLLIKHRLAPAQLRGVVSQVARALARCHAAGVVHRDLTPSNVAVTLEPLRVQLFDFSHAAAAGPLLDSDDADRLTGVFDVPGTAGYMSPEQAWGAAADAKMDVFALGVLIYEVITGRNPYPNVPHAEFVELQRRGRLEPPRLQAWIYEVHPEWAVIVADCTQADPARRPSMAAIAERVATLDARVGVKPIALPPNSADQTAENPDVAPEKAPVRAWMLPVLLLFVSGLALTTWAMLARRTTRADPRAMIVHNLDDAPRQTHDAPRPIADDEDHTVAETGVVPVLAEPDPAEPAPQPASKAKPDCGDVEASTERAKRARDWSSVLEHTNDKRCWPSDRDRVRLRVEALAQSKRWHECLRLADGLEDPELARWVSFCSKNI